MYKITPAAARVNAGLTQAKLAEILGVSESTVYKWENGKAEPSVTQAYKLAELAGVPVDAIIFLPEVTDKP